MCEEKTCNEVYWDVSLFWYKIAKYDNNQDEWQDTIFVHKIV